jgi:alpha-tubulin suppressor-like RCC1 family protein
MLQVVDFACGEYSSFALAQGGHVFAWGVNNYGQLAFPGKVSPPRTTQDCLHLQYVSSLPDHLVQMSSSV